MMSQKWEYSVQEIRTADAGGIAQHLNKLAEDGWELMFIGPIGQYYFKRAKKAVTQDEPDTEEDHIGRKFV